MPCAGTVHIQFGFRPMEMYSDLSSQNPDVCCGSMLNEQGLPLASTLDEHILLQSLEGKLPLSTDMCFFNQCKEAQKTSSRVGCTAWGGWGGYNAFVECTKQHKKGKSLSRGIQPLTDLQDLDKCSADSIREFIARWGAAS